MKRLLFAFLLLSTCAAVHAQDLIVLTDATGIEAKVDAVTADQVTYHKWSNLEGPSYTLHINQISFIKYQNGSMDQFKSTPAATRSASPAVQPAQTTAASARGPVVFQGYITSHITLGTDVSARGAGFSMGLRLHDKYYIGLETGLSFIAFENYYDWEDNTEDIYSPLALNMKWYMKGTRTISPYVDFTAGVYGMAFDYFLDDNFAYSRVLMGCDFSRFSIGGGYEVIDEWGAAVLKLGVRLGR